MICNGRRAEMPERDGRFLSTYSIQHLPQGWRIVIKESEKLP
jgi:hypothetical protein